MAHKRARRRAKAVRSYLIIKLGVKFSILLYGNLELRACNCQHHEDRNAQLAMKLQRN